MKATLVPATADAAPFIATTEACRMRSIGYVEKEYFLSGKAIFTRKSTAAGRTSSIRTCLTPTAF